jgi:hypothetical protein
MDFGDAMQELSDAVAAATAAREAQNGIREYSMLDQLFTTMQERGVEPEAMTKLKFKTYSKAFINEVQTNI